MTEKVKTVIEFYFLLPDFKSRGQPSNSTFKNVGIVQNRFEIIFEFCSQQKNILLGLTNRLVPKTFENSNEKLVKINREVQKFEKMQLSKWGKHSFSFFQACSNNRNCECNE